MKENLKPEDIEIFVPTYNRSAYLKQALQSIDNQTAKGFSVTVLDNACTDDTEQAVSMFKNVKYVKAETNGGGIENFKRAQNLASAKYIMYFHDDDILHPEYIETVLSILNKFGGLAFISSCFTWFKNDNVPDFGKQPPLSGEVLYIDKDFLFASSLFQVRYSSCICSFVYRKDLFKKIDWDVVRFGKLNDWPEAVRMANLGACAVITDKSAVYCREHQSRDSSDDSTGISARQLLNWAEFFYSVMKKDKETKKFYDRKIPIVLAHQYKFFVAENEKKKNDFNGIIKTMHEMGIISMQSKMFALRKENIFYRLLTMHLKMIPHPNLTKHKK
jgi:glycosyltransferase involved in cell wall biosynthesis